MRRFCLKCISAIQKQGWKFEILDADENGLGGYKEASAKITGKDVFSKLKFESGAHRVQRVPVFTESQGRVHTSAATVAVLPETRGKWICTSIRRI